MLITVDFNRKEEARALGARVIDGKWCIPENVSEENKKLLLEKFGTPSSGETSNVKQHFAKDAQREEFEAALQKSNLHLLIYIKEKGFPSDAHQRALVFRRFNNAGEQEYPVEYSSLRMFCPEIETIYPDDQIKDVIKNLKTPDFKAEISSSLLKEDMKELLLFILP